jgi:hypothetical protein
VSTATNEGRRFRRAVLGLAIMLIGICCLATAAQAAPKPAWRVLALNGPTNLAPKQSEVQRVTVEAEGGTFTLDQETARGEGTFSATVSFGETTEGSKNVTFFFTEVPFAVGEAIVSPAFPPGTTVAAVSGEPEAPLVEMSNPATESGFAEIARGSKEVTGVTASSGDFHVGDEISAEGEFSGPVLPPGTTVTAVGDGTLTVSDFPAQGGSFPLTAREATAPLAFDASAAAVQGAIEALPAFGAGSVTVSGGPVAGVTNPYFVTFSGPFANENLEKLGSDASALVGGHAAVNVFTTVPGGAGTGEISIVPANIGGDQTTGVYTVTLGPLPDGIVTAGPVKGTEWDCPDGAGESTISCTSSLPVRRINPTYNITVPIEVQSETEMTGTAPVTISGGGADDAASYEMKIVVSKQQARPGAQAFWAGAFDEEGNDETAAGGHPYSAQSYFLLNTKRSPSGKVVPIGDPKEVIVDLPPGFAGNPTVTPRCPQSQVAAEKPEAPVCTDESTIGRFSPILGYFSQSSSSGESVAGTVVSIQNTAPAKGYAAEFSTLIGVPIQSLLASVRSGDDYGVRITAPNNPNYNKIYGAYAAIEGFPAGAKGKAFLRNPTNCAEAASNPPVVRTKSATWQEPGNYSITTDQPVPPVTGCEELEFQPGFSFQPTSTQGSTPVGVTAHLHIPQDGLSDAGKLGTPDLKRAVVTLPKGLVLNPSSANGLEGCSEAQIGYRGDDFQLPNPIRFTEDSPSCPDGSKLGTVTVDSPLLDQDLQGTIYLANQEENPFGSLIAIYLAVDDARSGVVLKLPGEVSPDPNTGQLTATFDYNPQLPFEDLTLQFRGGGPRGQLATPEVCGSYETKGSWTPWSAPESGPPAQTTDGFTVSDNCASSPGARPFAPTLEAGTTDPLAGAYSPLTIKVGRKDGEQELQRFEFSLPPGLSGKLAGIPYCPEAAIAGAASRTGKEEQASPSCPMASRVGRVDTAAGVGSEPFHVGGSVYLAGPYKGAPLSTVVITPAVAGPFDLGNVVVRAPVYVDPQTARLTVRSDTIPTILEGLPLKVRSVSIAIDRSGFTINPTSCEEMSIGATVHSSDGATAIPANRFQVGGCDALKFAPKLKLSLKGGTKRNGHPALTATLNNPPGQANIGRVSVALPHSEFLEQGHIRTICTRVQFAADQCPKGSIYGHAEAISPLLDAKLTGPAYLRSSDNKLPDLVIALRGPDYQPVEIELAGRIDSINGGIRNSFELVPDAPVSKFVLRMQGGKRGLLVNSTDICRGKHKATVKMTGQNGKEHNFRTPLKAKCGKKAAAKKRRKG